MTLPSADIETELPKSRCEQFRNQAFIARWIAGIQPNEFNQQRGGGIGRERGRTLRAQRARLSRQPNGERSKRQRADNPTDAILVRHVSRSGKE